ncbi:MAG: hypothetical protein GDA68_09680 [Nitrospira sp. CR2.1]|nr:hypothetical protein [Nitrospira sp. CR2.1]
MVIPPYILRVCFVLAYAVLALPLPSVLLDHDLGLLTGDPVHTAGDVHAWLDHAAGSGLASGDAGVASADLVTPIVPPAYSSHESSNVQSPTVRGPPVH